MSLSEHSREAVSAAREPTTRGARHDVADTLSVASDAVKPAKTGIGRKIAIAGTAIRLARRYPMPALIIGGVVLAYYVTRRRSAPSAWH